MYPLLQTVKVRGLEGTTLANYEIRRETILPRRQDPVILILLRLKMQIAAGVETQVQLHILSFSSLLFFIFIVYDGIQSTNTWYGSGIQRE